MCVLSRMATGWAKKRGKWSGLDVGDGRWATEKIVSWTDTKWREGRA